MKIFEIIDPYRKRWQAFSRRYGKFIYEVTGERPRYKKFVEYSKDFQRLITYYILGLQKLTSYNGMVEKVIQDLSTPLGMHWTYR